MIEVGVLSEIFCLTVGLLSSVISPTEWTALTASSFYCREGIICLSIHAAQHNKRTKKTEKKRQTCKKGTCALSPELTFRPCDRTTVGCSRIKLAMHICVVLFSLSLRLISFAFFSPLRRPPCLWWISIMARSPFIQLISLLFYSNWQYFHTIMVYLLTAWILSKQERQKCGNVTGSPLILGDRIGSISS